MVIVLDDQIEQWSPSSTTKLWSCLWDSFLSKNVQVNIKIVDCFIIINYSTYSDINDDYVIDNRDLLTGKCSVVLNQYAEQFYCCKINLVFQQGEQVSQKWLWFVLHYEQNTDFRYSGGKGFFPVGLVKDLYSLTDKTISPLYCCWCTFKSFGQRHVHTTKICNKVRSTKY